MSVYPSGARERAELFQQLAADPTLGDQVGRLFELLAQGRHQAQQAELEQIAGQFAAGQTALLEALRSSGQFYDWELELTEVGLGCRRLPGLYRLLSNHYRHRAAYRQALIRQLWGPGLTLVLLGSLLPALAWWDGRLSSMSAMFAALLPLALLAASAGLRSLTWNRRWPGERQLARAEQLVLWCGTVALAVEGEMELPQALKQTARHLPAGPLRKPTLELAAAVGRGERFSESLLASGLLDGLTLDAPGAGAGPEAAPGLLLRAAERLREQRRQWSARWLPMGVLLWLPVLLALNGWLLSRGG